MSAIKSLQFKHMRMPVLFILLPVRMTYCFLLMSFQVLSIQLQQVAGFKACSSLCSHRLQFY